MTNGEKFKEVFKISQVDEGELYAYVWLPNHDAAEISIEWWNAEYEEPTTKNDCEHCAKTYGTLGCCDYVNNEPVYSCKEGHEEYARGIRKFGATIKNDLAHNLCDSCTNIGCEFQSGIVRTKCTFYMPPHIESDNCGNYIVQESTTKNDLGVNKFDKAINQSDLEEWIMETFPDWCEGDVRLIMNHMDEMPSVTPQELRWIPVSERLPEKDMACLVAVGRFNFTQIAVYSDLMGIIDHRIFYQGDVGHNSFKNITQYVKAWMPLPKPYREVEE